MKKEFLMLFKKRYPFLIMLTALMIIFILAGHIAFVSLAKGESDSVYSEFAKNIEPYYSKAELQELYNEALEDLEENGPGGRFVEVDGVKFWEKPPADYYVAVYKFLLDKDLPYDSIVDFDSAIKYTPFQYYINCAMVFGYFILIASILLGSLYQSSEVTFKMAKMVYSSGEKRQRIIDNKYGVSIIALLTFTILGDIIMSISAWGLFSNSGAKYCLIYTGSRLLSMNFFGFFAFILTSHLLMTMFIYTINYYISVMVKNGIIMLCGNFVLVILFMVIPFGKNSFLEWITQFPFLGGYIEPLCNSNYYTDFSCMTVLIPFVVLAVASAVGSRFVLKRLDYSR